MTRRAPTKAEKAHMNRVAALGCIACRLEGIEDTPATLHHIREGYGRGQRAPHTEVLPLCPVHHQYGGPGLAFHADPKAWRARYGSERELLERVYQELGYSIVENHEGEMA